MHQQHIFRLKGGECMYGKVLKATRKKAGLSQEEMAWRMNSNQASISRLENDKLSLDVESFARWMQITNSEVVGAALIFGIDVATTITQILPMLPINLIGGWFL